MKNQLDYFEIGDAFTDVNKAWMKDAPALEECCRQLNQTMLQVSRAVNQKIRAHAQSNGETSPADTVMNWVQLLAWSSKQYHDGVNQWLNRYIEQAPDLSAGSRQRARFWARQLMEMLAPVNFFWTNPKAVNRLIKSRGRSLAQGMQNWMSDMQKGDGLVTLSDPKAFTIGENLAATPGAVVYRNQLVEIIQYAPQTEKTWQVPVVLIQPWINKYYIFDLSPKNSLVRYLVNQGFTVFITSWKNPTAQMRHIDFEDYMLQGAWQAITVAAQICKSKRVHAAGYCIGGTLLAALLAWLARKGTCDPVVDATLFATLLDFSAPGDLSLLISHTSLSGIEPVLAADGKLEARHIAKAFRLLNPADLIWRYVVNNYFMGEPPPRSDMLYWNSDSTHLPEAMCRFFLTNFYIENKMARPNGLQLAGREIDLKQIRVPLYVVGAETDHICPWPATFQTCRLVAGPIRYVLTGDGHITGIVNPPSAWSKKKYWAAAATRRRDAAKWREKQAAVTGSWWPEWVDWLAQRSGIQNRPPRMGSRKYPVQEPAPGSYVHE